MSSKSVFRQNNFPIGKLKYLIYLTHQSTWFFFAKCKCILIDKINFTHDQTCYPHLELQKLIALTDTIHRLPRTRAHGPRKSSNTERVQQKDLPKTITPVVQRMSVVRGERGTRESYPAAG